MEQNEWLAISYTLPREPSRARVSVWRKLKKIGAVNVQQSVWLLPMSEENERSFREIKDEVASNGGESFLMWSSVDGDGRKILIRHFNDARDEEYTELLEQCEEFYKEIDKEIARKNFTFAEIEENEEELGKLKQWYEKIKLRDAFGAPLGKQAEAALSKCGELLDDFCEKVYQFNEKAQ